MKPQDMKDLRELIEFLKEYQVAEFDLDRGDTKIRLVFSQTAAAPAADTFDGSAALPTTLYSLQK